jgi:hypothetical protein
MAYLLDADVFIQAKKEYYGFDFCPAFWDWLDRENEAGKVVSIDKVREEFEPGGDDLVDWAKARAGPMFPPVSADALAGLGRVADWIQRQSYTAAAISGFLQDADYHLIGQALVRGDTVVTRETSAPAARTGSRFRMSAWGWASSS